MTQSPSGRDRRLRTEPFGTFPWRRPFTEGNLVDAEHEFAIAERFFRRALYHKLVVRSRTDAIARTPRLTGYVRDQAELQGSPVVRVRPGLTLLEATAVYEDAKH